MHTTCAVLINEFQTALLADIKRLLEGVVARDAQWMHNDPDYSDCDRMNADSHLRAMLLGHSLTLQISGGELVLGQWQRILAAELDGPRARTLRIQAFGLASLRRHPPTFTTRRPWPEGPAGVCCVAPSRSRQIPRSGLPGLRASAAPRLALAQPPG